MIARYNSRLEEKEEITEEDDITSFCTTFDIFWAERKRSEISSGVKSLYLNALLLGMTKTWPFIINEFNYERISVPGRTGIRFTTPRDFLERKKIWEELIKCCPKTTLETPLKPLIVHNTKVSTSPENFSQVKTVEFLEFHGRLIYWQCSQPTVLVWLMQDGKLSGGCNCHWSHWSRCVWLLVR